MLCARNSIDYIEGVGEFIEFACAHAREQNNIPCPCLRCFNAKSGNPVELMNHLLCHGIDQSYTRWTRHGEPYNEVECEDQEPGISSGSNECFHDEGDDGLEEMVRMVGEENPEIFEELQNDADTPLYAGSKYSRLRAVIKLYNLKSRYGWSDTSFNALLTFLRDAFPEDNTLPSKTYDAKKIILASGLKYEKMHACRNDCILYRNEYELLKECPKCGESRYEENGVSPAKVLWYFPIVPRLKRMYGNKDIAKLCTWHDDERIKDKKLRHPADAPQWMKIDLEYPEFSEEPRNLRFALASDGINPHGVQRTTYSTWPVILMNYNLPPDLIMKRKFMMLSMLIGGPFQPGNDIDVYLAPLIEDLKHMWDTGEEVFDACKEESFRLKAMLFGTINDFPAYGNLSGYKNKGYVACPICETGTHSIRLTNCKKIVYMGHRRFLPKGHRWRRCKKAFNGHFEEGIAPKILTGDEVFKKVEAFENNFGKPTVGNVAGSIWKKRSIFFELPYWKSLYIRHSLDVMHIEKNIFDNLIGTLLNVKGLSKDSVKSRLDMQEWGIRKELAPMQGIKGTYLPPAAYTLSRKEKKLFFEFLNGVKVPEDYSANVKNLVCMKDLKLKNLKTHDCHVLLQNFLPVAIRNILPKKLRATITKLCLFFKVICSKVVDTTKLNDLYREIVVILCELEMYFPPSFFDVMVHLALHLVREVQLCGPVYLRWMYPVERFLKVLKGYVKNTAHPEGCIAERYIADEASNLCADYLSSVEPIGMPKSRHDGQLKGKGLSAAELVEISEVERNLAHLHVLHNRPEVEPFVEEHRNLLRAVHGDRNESLITREHNKHFIKWFNERICRLLEAADGSVSENLSWLCKRPSSMAFSYTSYAINGYTFYTKARDGKSKRQNSGVTVVGEGWHISSAKDSNPIYAEMAYFGVIDTILELDYAAFRIPVFRCQWVNNSSGRRVDEYGFVSVDLSRIGYKDDPYILASHVAQVFYIADPLKKNWSIVMQSNKKNVEQVRDDDNDDECTNVDMNHFVENEAQFFTSILQDSDGNDDDVEDEPVYVRRDHAEGILIEPKEKKKLKKQSQALRKHFL